MWTSLQKVFKVSSNRSFKFLHRIAVYAYLSLLFCCKLLERDYNNTGLLFTHTYEAGVLRV